MLKNIKYIAIAAGALLLASSCSDDYLSTPPVGTLSPDGFYTTAAHLESGVLGVYAKLQNVEAGQYLTFSEDRSDNVWVDSDPNGIRTCSEVSFYRISGSTGELASLWSGWYSLIYNANMVLANIDGVSFTDEAVKNQFKGEVLFLRGLAHFELVRSFGRVPIIDHVLSSAEAKSIKQSEGKDVINNSVIPDLIEAESLLPYRSAMKSSSGSSVAEYGRADKLSAQALLARVYMTLKGYPYNDSGAKSNAKSYLEKVLQNGSSYFAPTITDWKRQFLTDNAAANKYQIFAIQHRLGTGLQVTFESGVGISNLDIVSDTYHSGSGMSPVYPEATLRYEYISNNDPRGFGFNFIDGYDEYNGTPAYVNRTNKFQYNGEEIESLEMSINVKWCPTIPKRNEAGIQFDDSQLGSSTSSRNQWPVNFPILRYEDMMLLYAELLVEDGNISEAMGYVNKIRERAGIELVPTGASASEAMNYIKRERKLELYLEGVRWFDMVRYGEWKELTIAKYDNYKINGEYRTNVSAGNVKDGRYLLPIPISELSAVPGLYEQNEGWKD